jgi:hypothetical protein
MFPFPGLRKLHHIRSFTFLRFYTPPPNVSPTVLTKTSPETRRNAATPPHFPDLLNALAGDPGRFRGFHKKPFLAVRKELD